MFKPIAKDKVRKIVDKVFTEEERMDILEAFFVARGRRNHPFRRVTSKEAKQLFTELAYLRISGRLLEAIFSGLIVPDLDDEGNVVFHLADRCGDGAEDTLIKILTYNGERNEA